MSSRIQATITIDGSESDDTFDIVIEKPEPLTIEPVTEQRPKRDSNGDLIFDDNGNRILENVVVSPGRRETEEEAVRRALAENLRVVEWESVGLGDVMVTIQYHIRGEVEIQFDADEVEVYENADGLVRDIMNGYLDDTVRDRITDELGYADWRYDDVTVEES